jgi:hypothetical protein
MHAVTQAAQPDRTDLPLRQRPAAAAMVALSIAIAAGQTSVLS